MADPKWETKKELLKNRSTELQEEGEEELAGLLASLLNVLEKIESIVQQHHELLESNSRKAWLDNVQNFLEDSLQLPNLLKKKATLEDLVDVGTDVHTCSLFATAEYSDEVAEEAPLDLTCSVLGLETNLENDCFSPIIDLTRKVNKLEGNGREYSALLFMADYAEEYVECWSNNFGQELKLKLKEVAAIAAELAAVLEMAYQFCICPVKLAFNFIGTVVHDFRKYTQMMNNLLKLLISSENTAGLDLILSLQRKVESDCRFLSSTIVLSGSDDLKNKRKLEEVTEPSEDYKSTQSSSSQALGSLLSYHQATSAAGLNDSHNTSIELVKLCPPKTQFAPFQALDLSLRLACNTSTSGASDLPDISCIASTSGASDLPLPDISCITSTSGASDLADKASKNCKFEGCVKGAKGDSGLCIAHGGGRRCERRGCNKGVEGRTVYCKAHGGGKRCQSLGCTKSAKGKTDHCIAHTTVFKQRAEGHTPLCKAHGGDKKRKRTVGTSFCVAHGSRKRCASQGWIKSAKGGTNYYSRHGGGKRCKMDNCGKGAAGSADFCKAHGGRKLCAWGQEESQHGPKNCKEVIGELARIPCERFARGKLGLCAAHTGLVVDARVHDAHNVENSLGPSYSPILFHGLASGHAATPLSSREGTSTTSTITKTSSNAEEEDLGIQ